MSNNDTIGLGCEVSLPIAPTVRYGRVVMIIKAASVGGHPVAPRYVVREFRPGDRAFPTGPLKRLSPPFVQPWAGGA